ncbi:serine/threonine kinase-like domain-containing protein STKLD1 isoform X2 [Physella acuta]|uniref:serine/threonine kinase-like domain-containing protein STKLD1 isoform X2 n=1 Tax=Physella acuta TaxID=109671 RepID=UPI0027DC0724|nr:serine/threonine kinase-like domain-containing protein STKLD1 isoform X2 [Physella acuta]
MSKWDACYAFEITNSKQLETPSSVNKLQPIISAQEPLHEDDTSSDDDVRQHMDRFHAPSIFQIYKVLENISQGSPGSVYLVKNRQDKQKYALKKVECLDESAAVKAFYEEMELKKLDHTYLQKCKDFFITYTEQDSSVFINIISEYYANGDLKNWIKKFQNNKQIIPEKTLSKILGEVLNGLVYLHDNGVIHRNIKSSNIFLNENSTAVLGDLGVSSLMGDMRTNTRQTFKGVAFMAPEVVSQPHDERSDLFSLGGVLLNMMTTSMYSQDEFYRVLTDIKQSPTTLNEVLLKLSEIYSKTLVTTVQVLLRHKHSARPSTLEFIKSGFIQECMALADSLQIDKRARQKETKSTKTYSLNEGQSIEKVLEYIADTIDHEKCVAEGLAALAELVRDEETAHQQVDQKARNLISLAMWDNIFNRDVQIAGCYVLSNLAVYAQPDDILFTPHVITIIHKIMTAFEYDPEVQQAAVNLILALSADKVSSRIIVQLGGIQDILIAMRHAQYHAALNAVCCTALWSLTVDAENLKVAGNEKAVRDVCIALSIHKVSPQVSESAAAALISLLLDDGCYDPFNELDCVGNLIFAIHLHTNNARVVNNSCKVLAMVVQANEECAFRFLTSADPDDDSPTGIPTILKAYHLHKDNALVVEAIVRLILELTSYEDICSELQGSQISSNILRQIHKRYKENKDIMAPCEEALGRLGTGLNVSRTQKS